MFNIDGQIYIRRSSASRLIGLDYRTLEAKAERLGIRTAHLAGQRAELYHLGDLQRVLDAARQTTLATH